MAKDMRTWIAQLDAADELRRVRKQVDPYTEMGALLWQSKEHALLFENLAGHSDWTALGQAVANWRHAALVFDTTPDRLVSTFAARLRERVPWRDYLDGAPFRPASERNTASTAAASSPPVARTSGASGGS